ncbi:MAG: PhzF family phenazine biosynthesis protein [Actinomycetota bacterium]|nr:PhzF family phenazine biosynthesis protein [Actinomycetota bacterium]
MEHHYRLVNVFTVDDDPFSGNPLAVFVDASSLDRDRMQDIARQLNLSETTFVTALDPGDGVDATVRVFTPGYELPFAGHPTLGTAYVVAEELADVRPSVVLGMPAGRVPVRLTSDRSGRERLTLTTAVQPQVREVTATTEQLAAMVGLTGAELGDDPLWVNTGVEQLIVPVRHVEALRRAVADPRLLRVHGQSGLGESLVYLWTPTGPDTVEARLFFTQGAGVVEDPATGSACANLGGWFHHRGERGLHRVVRQGDAVHRPSQLFLEVLPDGAIEVGGAVYDLGAGTMRF